MEAENIRMPCPECSPRRKKKSDRCMSVKIDGDTTLYHCHHCGHSGAKKADNIRPIPTQRMNDTELIHKYLNYRGISFSDISDLPIITDKRYFHAAGKIQAIGFVYGDKENPEAVKWRALKRKAFTQDNAARRFFMLDELPENPKQIVICEGELDALALKSCGIDAVSVPNGAPQRVSNRRISPEDDTKFGYLWDAEKILNAAEKIILATDADDPGEALAEEIARRVGRAKCARTRFPDGVKDVTELLKKHGEKAVQDAIEASEDLPLAGVYGAKSYLDQVTELYAKGVGAGESTGYASLDKLFTIAPSMLTVVTGHPGHGKSEFLDQLAVNLASRRNWKFAMASFENPPQIHIAKLAEKIAGKPFFEGSGPRMDSGELKEAVDFVHEHFLFLDNKSGELATIASIIDRTKQAILRRGVRALVIDPYNYIQHEGRMEEHSAISHMLTKIISFCQAHEIHVFFVAHPAKMQPLRDGSFPVPTGHHISGSAAWFSKPDLGITVQKCPQGVDIHCWKSRFKWIGQTGAVRLNYDPVCGLYSEPKKGEWEGLDW